MKTPVNKPNLVITQLKSKANIFANSDSVEYLFSVAGNNPIPPLHVYMGKIQVNVVQQKINAETINLAAFGPYKHVSLLKILLPSDYKFMASKKIHFLDAIDSSVYHDCLVFDLYQFLKSSNCLEIEDKLYLAIDPFVMEICSSVSINQGDSIIQCEFYTSNSDVYLVFDNVLPRAKKVIATFYSKDLSKHVSFDIRSHLPDSELDSAAYLSHHTLPKVSEAPKSLVVLKLDHIGDFLIALDALKSLRETLSDWRIDLVCGPWVLDYAKRLNLFDNVYAYNYFTEKSGDWNGVSPHQMTQALHNLSSIVTHSYDLACDFRVDADTRYLLKAIRARAKVGFEAPNIENILTRSLEIKDISPRHLAKSSSIEDKHSSFYPGIIGMDDSLHLVPTRGMASICIMSNYLRSQYEVEGNGDERQLSFGIESIQLVKRMDGKFITVDTCDIANAHSKKYFHEIEKWGFWSRVKIAPLFIKFKNFNDEQATFALKLVMRVPFYHGEDRAVKKIMIHTLYGEYSFEFTGKNATQTLYVPILMNGYSAGYFFSTNSANLPSFTFVNRNSKSQNIFSKIAAFNKFGIVSRFQDRIAPRQFFLANSSIPLTDLIQQNGIFFLGEVRCETEILKPIQLMPYDGEISSEPAISTLQHRSVAFQVLADIITAELKHRKLLVQTFPPKIRGHEITIGICTGANSDARKWAISSYIRLIELLMSNQKVRIELYGSGKLDMSDAERIISILGQENIKNYVNSFGLSEVGKKLSQCNFFVGNNSGLGHLAASLNVPSFIVFSGTNEVDRWRPFRNSMIITNQVSCAPCHLARRSDCPNAMKCMDELSPEYVYASICSKYPFLKNKK